MSPLLMIPGPVEVSPGVKAAAPSSPPSHVSEGVRRDFSTALTLMRHVWLASEDAQPFVVGGGGTLAMEMAVYNLIDPGDSVVVVNTGYFSARMAEMLRRAGADVRLVGDAPGRPLASDALAQVLSEGSCRAVFATHVDTSTGIRMDPKATCRVAREHGVLTVFDGVCATAAEQFEMAAWGADVYLTASQKAIGLPAGLGLMVVSAAALERRQSLNRLPPLLLDWQQWLPVMRAYEEQRGAYFSTPPTTLLPPLRVGLEELLAGSTDPYQSMRGVFERHQDTADRLRRVWALWGLKLLAPDDACAANTLSTLRYPEGVGPELLGEIRNRGVVVAGGLFPGLAKQTFRVGHMGYAITRQDWMSQVVRSIGESLNACGYGVDVEEGLRTWGA